MAVRRFGVRPGGDGENVRKDKAAAACADAWRRRNDGRLRQTGDER